MFLVASFGATAVLLYSSHTSPLAQPRNVLVGHFVSSVAGVTVYKVRFLNVGRRACMRLIGGSRLYVGTCIPLGDCSLFSTTDPDQPNRTDHGGRAAVPGGGVCGGAGHLLHGADQLGADCCFGMVLWMPDAAAAVWSTRPCPPRTKTMCSIFDRMTTTATTGAPPRGRHGAGGGRRERESAQVSKRKSEILRMVATNGRSTNAACPYLPNSHVYISNTHENRAGYLFVIFPCLTGALFMVLISLVCNNLDTHRVYPLYWSKYV